MGHGPVERQFNLVRFVVGGIVPGTAIDGFRAAVLHLAQLTAGITVREPAGYLAHRALHHHLHAIGTSKHRHQGVGQLRIHGQHGAALVIQRVAALLVIALQGQVDPGAQKRPVHARCALPTGCRRNIGR